MYTYIQTSLDVSPLSTCPNKIISVHSDALTARHCQCSLRTCVKYTAGERAHVNPTP